MVKRGALGGAIKKADFWVRDDTEFGHGFFKPSIWRRLVNKLKQFKGVL